MSIPRLAGFVTVLLCCVAFGSRETPAGNTDPEYRKLRDAQLTESFLVENVVIQRDAGVITLRQGTISFAPPVLGRVTLGVFVGEGEFVLAPPPSMERDYLKSVAGGEAIKESLRQAVFCFTDGTYDEIRADGKAVALEARAAEVLKNFRERVRRREEEPRSFVEALVTSEMMDNIEAEMLADLYNPKRPGFFSVYMFGNKLKDLRFQIKLSDRCRRCRRRKK